MKLKTTIFMAVVSLLSPAQAATIAWGSVSGVTSSTSVLNNGTAVSAVNFGGAAQTVNGVSFDADGGGSSTYWTGEGGNSTGNTGLDQIINTHDYSIGGAHFEFSLTGLMVGQKYQIQLIGIHDRRTNGNISSRTYTLPDATGTTPTFSGPQLTRNAGGNDSGGSGSALGTVVGIFTAGAGTEIIRISEAPSNKDPGLSGYSLRAVPEPSSAALLGLGGLALIMRRRK